MRADLLKRAVALIAAIGADPGDGPELALQRTLLVGVSLTCVVAGIFWGLVYVAVGAGWPAASRLPTPPCRAIR